MLKNQNELDEHLAGKLRLLEKVSPLKPEAVTEVRQKFLAQASTMRATAEQNRQPQVGGLQGWLLALRGKQRLTVSNMVMALVLALALILGSTGATVYAAQASLPDQLLYPVKTLTEETRLALTTSPEKQLELMLDYSNQRLDEIAQLRSMGKPVPEGAIVRTQEQLDAALTIAADLNDQQLVQALAQIRHQAETQAEQMVALMSGVTEEVDPALLRLQERLQAQAQLAAEGEVDPEGFRLMVRAWTRERYRPAPASGAGSDSEAPYGNGEQGNKATVTPGQYGPGSPDYTHPPIDKEPTNGSGTNEGESTEPSGPAPTLEEPLPRPQSQP